MTAIGVNRGLPGVWRKLRELRARQLVGDIVQRAMQPAQLDAADRVHATIVTYTARPRRWRRVISLEFFFAAIRRLAFSEASNEGRRF